ncbi:MAG: patatin-like phospholipase family protein [Pseudomonadota bacterium]
MCRATSVNARKTRGFENLVFAGGGNRCFWQAGFWSVTADAVGRAPARIAAVSAGAAVSCALFSKTFDAGFTDFKRAVEANQRNLYLKNLLRKRPVFPHGDMYRQAILNSIGPQALSQLHRGPDIRVLIAAPPRWASRGVAMALGMAAWGIDVLQGNGVHTSGGQRVGFRPLFISVRQCKSPETLADLIIASSCVPPLTPQARREGVALFDGGILSNVPVDGIEQQTQGETLVLLTRQFSTLPKVAGRTYVQPSQPIPVKVWDYTDASAMQSAFDLGRRDGEKFCKTLKA